MCETQVGDIFNLRLERNLFLKYRLHATKTILSQAGKS